MTTASAVVSLLYRRHGIVARHSRIRIALFPAVCRQSVPVSASETLSTLTYAPSASSTVAPARTGSSPIERRMGGGTACSPAPCQYRSVSEQSQPPYNDRATKDYTLEIHSETTPVADRGYVRFSADPKFHRASVNIDAVDRIRSSCGAITEWRRTGRVGLGLNGLSGHGARRRHSARMGVCGIEMISARPWADCVRST